MLFINILQRKEHRIVRCFRKTKVSQPALLLSPGFSSNWLWAQGKLQHKIVKIKGGRNVLDHGPQLRFFLLSKSQKGAHYNLHH